MSSLYPYLAAGALVGTYAGRYMKSRKVPTKELAIRNARKIKRIQRGSLHELKTHDAVVTTAPGTTGVITLLSGIGQGDTSLSREGLVIAPKNLQYRFRFVQHASATSTFIRVIIFTDTEQHGVIPGLLDLLEVDDDMSFIEHDTRPRFRILRDMNFVLGDTNVKEIFVKGYIKLRGKMNFGGTAATITSMGKNALFMYIVSSEASNVPARVTSFRLRYTDG